MRWLRIAAPLGIAALLLTVTGITYAIEQPDPTDTDFLSPVSEAPIGGRALADALRAEGVDVHRTTSTLDAIGAAYEGDATLFVPAPGVSHPDYLRMLASLPASTRIVLVDPSARTLDTVAAPGAGTGRRGAAKATEAGCSLDGAPPVRHRPTRRGPPGRPGGGAAAAVRGGRRAVLRLRAGPDPVVGGRAGGDRSERALPQRPRRRAWQSRPRGRPAGHAVHSGLARPARAGGAASGRRRPARRGRARARVLRGPLGRGQRRRRARIGRERGRTIRQRFRPVRRGRRQRGGAIQRGAQPTLGRLPGLVLGDSRPARPGRPGRRRLAGTAARTTRQRATAGDRTGRRDGARPRPAVPPGQGARAHRRHPA
ncbi:DUF4350 domain-containing protein [Micromonospora sp. CPCC 205371]|nr:DUF4350 domain-containing protein [Micromonospora sp. CPCC 205371]